MPAVNLLDFVTLVGGYTPLKVGTIYTTVKDLLVIPNPALRSSLQYSLEALNAVTDPLIAPPYGTAEGLPNRLSLRWVPILDLGVSHCASEFTPADYLYKTTRMFVASFLRRGRR